MCCVALPEEAHSRLTTEIYEPFLCIPKPPKRIVLRIGYNQRMMILPQNSPHPPEFAQIEALIEQRLGLDIARRTNLNLAEILYSITDLPPFKLRFQLQNQPTHSPLWQKLIRELTIGETYFFRNRAQFDILRTHILPQIIEQQRASKTLTVWSAGCATGEELYSVALLLMQCLPDYRQWNLTLLGTDINAAALDSARNAHYRRWSFRYEQDPLLANALTQTDKGYQLHPELRQMVQFRHGNLLEDQPPLPANLVLCRNVMIYFKRDARQHAERMLMQATLPHGWLLLGHAEALNVGFMGWQTHIFTGTLAYQRQANNLPTPNPVYHQTVSTAPLRLHAEPAPAAPLHYSKALEAFHQEDYENAHAHLQKHLSTHPQDLAARVLWAATLINRAQADAAKRYLEQLIATAPLTADAYFLQAMLYLEEDNLPEAQKALRAALYSQQSHPLAALMLGSLRAQHKDYARARNLWQQARAYAQQLPPTQPISDLDPRSAADFIALIDSLFSTLP